MFIRNDTQNATESKNDRFVRSKRAHLLQIFVFQVLLNDFVIQKLQFADILQIFWFYLKNNNFFESFETMTILT